MDGGYGGGADVKTVGIGKGPSLDRRCRYMLQGKMQSPHTIDDGAFDELFKSHNSIRMVKSFDY